MNPAREGEGDGHGDGDRRPDDDEELDRLIDRADLDGLVRLIDELGAARRWDRLDRLATRARWALGTGRQLWPAATLAEYRLALRAPARWAAPTIGDEGGHFSIGPLTEVIAQNHAWGELAPFLERSMAAGAVAHERVLRGEDLRGDPTVEGLPDPFGLPWSLEPWEPAYRLAAYSDDGFDADPPPLPVSARFVGLDAGRGTVIDDEDVVAAFRQLVEPWTASSNGRAEIVAVEGGADLAVATLGVPPERTRLARLGTDEALSWLAWAGASGGAHGRRRGGALGRFGAWWTVAALGDALDEWPLPGPEIAVMAGELAWYWWDAAEPAGGWRLQLAIHDPADGLAWAVNARDAAIV